MIITQRSILWTAGRLPRKRCSESHSLPLALAPAAPMPQRSTPPAGGRTACQAKRSLALVKTLFGCLWRYGHAVGGQRSRMCFWRHGQGESQQLMRVGSAYCEAPRAFSAKMSTPGSGRCVNAFVRVGVKAREKAAWRVSQDPLPYPYAWPDRRLDDAQ